MALTQAQRAQLIGGLVENGWDEDMLGNLTDNQLVALDRPDELDELVTNAAAHLEDDDEEEELTDNEFEDDLEEEEVESPSFSSNAGNCAKTLNELSDDELMMEMAKRKKGKKKDKMTGNSRRPCNGPVEEMTVNQYVAQMAEDGAPQAVIDLIVNAQAQQEAERAELIEIITANEANDYTPQELKRAQMVDLKRMAKLALSGMPRRGSRHNDYTANAGGMALIGNSGGEDPLDIPDLGWSRN